MSTSTDGTTNMVESTNTTHRLPGTHAEIVQNMIALGWDVAEETEQATTLIHSLITGTVRRVYK